MINLVTSSIDQANTYTMMASLEKELKLSMYTTSMSQTLEKAIDNAARGEEQGIQEAINNALNSMSTAQEGVANVLASA